MVTQSPLILLLPIFWIINPGLSSHPVMTHTSMDVGNIISIIIPESPDTTINVDQLTADFRRQLERIHKQSRVNKLEHGLVTLKNVLPQMSKEEKKKSLPLIRRVLQTRRLRPPKNSTKESAQRKVQKSKNTRRSPAKNTNNNNKRNNKSKPTANTKAKPTSKRTPKQVKKQKTVKNPEAYLVEDTLERRLIEKMKNEDDLSFKDDYRQTEWRSPVQQRRRSMSVANRADGNSDIVTVVDFDKNEELWRPSSERDINRPNRRASQFPCSEGANEYKVRSTKDIRGFDIGREEKNNDCDKGFDADGQPISCYKGSDDGASAARGEVKVFNYPVEVPSFSGDDDEFKGFERILQSPQDSIRQTNSTGPDEEDAPGKGVHEQIVEDVPLTMNQEFRGDEKRMTEDEKRRNFVTDDQVVGRVPYSSDVEVIPRVGRQFVDFDKKNFEIRIARSIDNHLVRGSMVKSRDRGDLQPRVNSGVDGGRGMEKMKRMKKQGKKMKKPWKTYPRSLDKQVIHGKI
ncbi:uncharacterized protein LOC135162095 isoform X2 [Diachasmimorpha longicaudata]|uniref:uncharacterized protein LOC135162095 isoform X2 n=1 Tax=Diachasmimorpha longicaudata TaxID=58733 RepID=UPI0030B8FC67